MAGAVTRAAPVPTVFRELSAAPRNESLPLSHLSVELGHLYMEDFAAGPERLREQFRRVASWAKAAAAACLPDVPRPRVSTCFLIDDYFNRFSTPLEVVPRIIDAARSHGLEVDYLVRESACADYGEVSPARLLESRLVPVPAEGSDGSRPGLEESGWLSNGHRSPGGTPHEAMGPPEPWIPPREAGARRHSVFLDVQLWSEDNGERTWSCAHLAAVWQLLRLGLLRDHGRAVVAPVDCAPGDLPADWDELPALSRLNPQAAPFSAYRTLSLVPSWFLPVEHAVRVILEQTSIQQDILRQVAERSRRDSAPTKDDLVSRVSYAFFEGT